MNKVASVLIMAFAILGALFVGLVIYYAVVDTNSGSTYTPVRNNTGDVRVQPETLSESGEARRQYMAGCVGGQASELYCACTYNYMVDSVGLNGVLDLAEEYGRTDVLPDLLYDAAYSCM